MKITDLKNYTVVGGNGVPVSSASSVPEVKTSKSLGQKVLDAGTSVSNFFGGKGVADTFGATIAKIGKSKEEKDIISSEQPSVKETIGSGIQLGANFLPGVGKGVGLLGKMAVGAGTGYALDVGSKLQNKDKTVGESITPGIGTAVGTALPVAGAVGGYATRVMGRLFKGLGSGISGVSTKTLDDMLTNPKVAQKASEKLAQNGNFKVIEENAKNVVNGISNIKKGARIKYGEGVATLKSEDIKPDVFRKGVKGLFDKYGFSTSKQGREIANVEFRDVKNLKKANSIANMLTNTELNGLSLNKTLQRIDDLKYPSPKTEEGLAFNAFVNDISNNVKQILNQSTDKLGEINKAFSNDMQLAEATEKIFGKVKYKNVEEIANAANKLEGLFNEKGLDPKTIDNFLTKIGVSSKNFRTGEAVRQITNKELMPPNTPGFNFGEIFRTTTSSIMTPETIRNITIKTGLAKEKLTPLMNGLKSLSPALQKVVIQALLQTPQ